MSSELAICDSQSSTGDGLCTGADTMLRNQRAGRHAVRSDHVQRKHDRTGERAVTWLTSGASFRASSDALRTPSATRLPGCSAVRSSPRRSKRCSDARPTTPSARSRTAASWRPTSTSLTSVLRISQKSALIEISHQTHLPNTWGDTYVIRDGKRMVMSLSGLNNRRISTLASSGPGASSTLMPRPPAPPCPSHLLQHNPNMRQAQNQEYHR